MKMRNLFCGVILGLLAVVHSSPLSTVTQDDVYREAVTDGYIVDYDFGIPLVTESPKTNTTVQPSQQPALSDDIEASGEEVSMFSEDGRENFPSTTPQAEIPQSSWVPDEAGPTDSDMMEGSADDSHWTMATMFPVQGSEEDATTTSSTTEIPQSVSSSSDLIEDSTDSNSVLHHHGGEASATTTSSTTEIPESISSSSDIMEDSTDGDAVLHHQGGEADATTTSSTTEIPQSVSSSSHLTEDNTDSNSVLHHQGGEADATTTSSTTEIPETVSSSADIEEDSEEDASTTVSPVPSEDESNVTPDIISVFHDTAVTAEEGSGSEDMMSTTEPSILSTTSMRAVIDEVIKETSISKQGKGMLVLPEVSQVSEAQTEDTDTENAGHSTPGWIIIVGFIVGLAALVMLFVAIATRDKWNGPRQVSEPQPSSSNQQRELEMETFLHKEMPKENGKAAEYTVIPLDEFPDKFSSH